MIKGWLVLDYWDVYIKYKDHHKTKQAGTGVAMPCEWSPQLDIPFSQQQNWGKIMDKDITFLGLKTDCVWAQHRVIEEEDKFDLNS